MRRAVCSRAGRLGVVLSEGREGLSRRLTPNDSAKRSVRLRLCHQRDPERDLGHLHVESDGKVCSSGWCLRADHKGRIEGDVDLGSEVQFDNSGF